MQKPLKTVRLDAFLKSYMIPLADTRVRWLSFVGTNASAFIRIANKLKLHPLAVCAVMMYAGHMLNARDVRERVGASAKSERAVLARRLIHLACW